MVPATQAEQIILDLVQPFEYDRDAEILELPAALGRVLAQSVTSTLDFPHWDNSAMDGYAVRFEDVQCCDREHPVTLEIVEEIPAGSAPQKTIGPGQAARILTGSVMPAGSDTVVMQEETTRADQQVTILSAPKSQAFVRHQGAFYQANQPLLAPGWRLQAPEMAVLAAAQCDRVPVYRRPRVAILSTGNELVDIHQPLQPGQIVDSNQYALAALITQAGALPLPLGIVPDQPEALRQAIQQAIATADVVLSSGGVSVGDYDYVDQILAELGAEIHIRAVAIKPGKPLTVATFGRGQGAGGREQGAGELTPSHPPTLSPSHPFNPSPSHPPTLSPSHPSPILYFGLPGNPVSALVTFWRFVHPALKKLSGVAQPWQPTFVQARTRQDLKSDGKRESYCWGRLFLVEGRYEFELAGGSHSSGNLINLAGTNGLAVIPLGNTLVTAGDAVQVMLVG